MGEAAIIECLEQLAGTQLSAMKGSHAASYPAAWMLLDLLEMLPEGNKAKKEAHQSQQGLAGLVATAHADERHALQAAAKLFIELGNSNSPSTHQQLAEYLCSNPSACRLLVHSTAHARERGGGGPWGSAEALYKAEYKITSSILETVLGAWPSQPQLTGGSYPAANSTQHPAKVLHSLIAVTQLADRLSRQSSASLTSQFGAALLQCFRWLEQCVRSLGKEYHVDYSLVVRSWALHASNSMLAGAQSQAYSSPVLCKQMVDYYFESSLPILISKCDLKGSWFREDGPLTGLALICSRMSQVLRTPWCHMARAAALPLVTVHACSLLRLMILCLDLASRPAEQSRSSGRAGTSSYSSQGQDLAAGRAAAAARMWRGLPRDAVLGGSVLTEFVESAVELLVVVLWGGRHTGEVHVPPADLSALEDALHAVVSSSGQASWLPIDIFKQLRSGCSFALQELELLFPPRYSQGRTALESTASKPVAAAYVAPPQDRMLQLPTMEPSVREHMSTIAGGPQVHLVANHPPAMVSGIYSQAETAPAAPSWSDHHRFPGHATLQPPATNNGGSVSVASGAAHSPSIQPSYAEATRGTGAQVESSKLIALQRAQAAPMQKAGGGVAVSDEPEGTIFPKSQRRREQQQREQQQGETCAMRIKRWLKSSLGFQLSAT